MLLKIGLVDRLPFFTQMSNDVSVDLHKSYPGIVVVYIAAAAIWKTNLDLVVVFLLLLVSLGL